MNIFICYAKEDFESASRLYQDLMGVPGVTPWLDAKKLLPGVRWKLEVMETLRTCDLCVVLLSSNSVAKNGFVQQEITEALDKLKSVPPDRIFLIPARIDNCHPRHPELQELHWVDLFPEWDTGFAEIVRAIQRLKGEVITPPTVPDDIVMETITSAESFKRRLTARGEMKGCDAMELEFSGEKFKGIDFGGANFVRSHFVGCDFRFCNLKGVNFEGAVFKDCRFGNADLWGVNFWGANTTGIHDLEQAIMKHTNFFGARLSEAQRAFLSGNPNTVSLGDYSTFIIYFQKEVGMSDNIIARTFVWINHRYFRMMFGKNSDQVFRTRLI